MSKARNLATFGSTKTGHISGDSATFSDTVTAGSFVGSGASLTGISAHDSVAVQAQIDSAAVALTGDQTIAGIKTFSDSAHFDSPTKIRIGNSEINLNGGATTGANFANRVAPFTIGFIPGVSPASSDSSALLFDGNQIEQAMETNSIYLNYNSSANVRMVEGGGNVGINTTNPTSHLTVNGSINEKQSNFTGTDIDADNGTIQYVTLSGNVTYTSSLDNGEYVTLMIDDGSAYSVTWPTITWVGGSAPTLETTGYNVIELWRVAGTLYGAFVGVA